MIGEEIRNEGSAALSVAAAELIEDHHDELAAVMTDDVDAQLDRMRRLRKLGMDLAVLGEAGIVLVSGSLPSAGSLQTQTE
jgi:hypothetical protein